MFNVSRLSVLKYTFITDIENPWPVKYLPVLFIPDHYFDLFIRDSFSELADTFKRTTARARVVQILLEIYGQNIVVIQMKSSVHIQEAMLKCAIRSQVQKELYERGPRRLKKSSSQWLPDLLVSLCDIGYLSAEYIDEMFNRKASTILFNPNLHNSTKRDYINSSLPLHAVEHFVEFFRQIALRQYYIFCYESLFHNEYKIARRYQEEPFEIGRSDLDDDDLPENTRLAALLQSSASGLVCGASTSVTDRLIKRQLRQLHSERRLLEKLIEQLLPGLLDIQITTSTTLGKTEIVRVQACRDTLVHALKQAGLEPGTSQYHEIRIGEQLKLELIAARHGDFSIKALTCIAQPILTRKFSTWEWCIVGKRTGPRQCLYLKVSNLFPIGTRLIEKSQPAIPMFIEVNSDCQPIAPSDVTCRSSARLLLMTTLRSDSELEAFCVDIYPNVHAQFTNGMDRIRKVNILLTNTNTDELISNLSRYYSMFRVAVSEL